MRIDKRQQIRKTAKVDRKHIALGSARTMGRVIAQPNVSQQPVVRIDPRALQAQLRQPEVSDQRERLVVGFLLRWAVARNWLPMD